MALCPIRDPKIAICIILAAICTVSFITFFTLGGITFANENGKLTNYKESMCQVNSSSVTTYQCSKRNRRYTCYGAEWKIYHGVNYTRFAVIKDSARFGDLSKAVLRSQQYKVREYFKDIS